MNWFFSISSSAVEVGDVNTRRVRLGFNRTTVASLEKRKIYIALRDAGAEKHGLLRIVDESGEDYLYPKTFSFDRLAAIRQDGRAGRGVRRLNFRLTRIASR